MMRTVSLFIAMALVVAAPATGLAQLNPFASPQAMDTMNAAPAGGGLNPGTFIDRAQGVAGGGGLPGAAPNPFGAAPASPFGAPAAPAASPFGAPAASPFGAPAAPSPFGAAAAPAGNPFGAPASPFGAPASPFGAPAAPAPGGDPFAGVGGPILIDEFGGQNFQQQPQIVLPQLPTWERVLGGERVRCAVTGRILQDASWMYVWQTEAQQNFFDDGTNGDAVANDRYRSNITERNDVVAPIVWRVFRQTKQMIRTAEEKDPIRFFQLVAVTTDPASTLPQLIDRERDRDTRIREWNNKFLREFRVNPDDERSEFYRPFIPTPPPPPDIPVPVGFTAPARTAFTPGQPIGSFDQFLNTAGGLQAGPTNQTLGSSDPFAGGVTGDPLNPAASSNYFSTTAK